MDTGHFQSIVRDEFSALKSLYFNAAYFGPYPKRTQDSIRKTTERFSDPSFYPYTEWIDLPDTVRDKISKILDCKAENIAHGTSVSDNIAVIANSLKKKKFVTSWNGDFPSNVHPWLFAKEHGRVNFKLMEAPNLFDADWLAKNLPPETEIFDISHVTFNTGRKIDLISIGKLLKERGIYFIVDVTQSLGGIKITKEELSYIDVLACSTYKWMLSPYGHSFCYISDRFLKELNSINGTWINNPNFRKTHNILAYTTERYPKAIAFDRGQAPNMLNMNALSSSLDLFLELGLDNIETHNKNLAEFFFDNFQSNNYQIATPKEGLSNIICLKTKKDTLQVKKDLEKENIDISIRAGNLRISFHLFNTIEQVERLLAVINKS